MRRSKYLTLSAIIGCIWVLYGYFTKDHNAQTEKLIGQNNITINVLRSQAMEITHTLEAQARLCAYKTIPIRSFIDAEVKYIAESGYIRKNDVIIKLDGRYYKEELDEARKQFQAAELHYEAQNILLKRRLGSESEVIKAKAALMHANAALEKAKLNYDYTIIKAPFDGYIHDTQVEVAQKLANQSEILKFSDISKLKAITYLSQEEMKHIDPDTEAIIRAPDAGKIKAGIYAIDIVPSKETNTFKVELIIDNAGQAFRAGEIVKPVFALSKLRAHKIPYSSLSIDGSGNLGVKTLIADNIVQFKPVNILKRDKDAVLVNNLESQENIITLGHPYVKTGDKLNLPINYENQPYL